MQEIKKDILDELSKMNLRREYITNIKLKRSKSGIHVYNIYYSDKSYVLKYFEHEKDTREIKNYSILKDLSVPTVKVIDTTKKSILLEDIQISKDFRLGRVEDLSDLEIARCIAKWYKLLHMTGTKYLIQNESHLYRETELITKKNIDFVIDESGTQNEPIWTLILQNFQVIKDKISELDITLTYNDFYWTNLVVGKDKSRALMFDYNLMGIGYRYGDIRNVCTSLSKECREVFMEEYGVYNDNEKAVDDVVSMLLTLILAFKRITFPSWGQYSLDILKSRDYYNRVVQLCSNS